MLPWDEWWEFELNKDNSNPHIALLPLHPDMRAKFNESSAWEYARSMEGKPYGYHNMIFSWIDTIDGNYPPPLDAHLVSLFNFISVSMVYPNKLIIADRVIYRLPLGLCSVENADSFSFKRSN